MKLNELPQHIDIDIDAALARFAGSEALYCKFLKKLTEDTTFSSLESAVAAKDLKETEKSAHTLKGVSANLGLTALTQSCDALVQAARAEDVSQVSSLFPSCESLYRSVVDTLSQLE